MEKFTSLRGIAAPLRVSNVDTGALAPTQWWRDHPDNLAGGLFRNWRYDASGAENPDFVLNQARYRVPQILVTGPNFGCGSSRETAVWALMRFGIKCVVAPSFAEIFYDNCFQNGLLPVVLEVDDVERLMIAVEEAAEPLVTVDLEACCLEMPGGSGVEFHIAADRRLTLLEGLDQTMMIRRYDPDIAAFRAQDREQRPWIYYRPEP